MGLLKAGHLAERTLSVPLVLAVLVLVMAYLGWTGCGDEDDIILATTTSTLDSGLLDVLIPAFEDETDFNVKPIGVGSGQAMEMGRRGDADVLLVHSPAAEEEFMREGHGTNRRLVMHNDFVIVGPPSDPAGAAGLDVITALRAIADSGSLFLSRGDNSGTHAKELALWQKAELSPKGNGWYQESGQGMGDTLTIADQKDAYTLSDRGTYLALKKNFRSQVLVEGDAPLINIYHVIQLDPVRHPEVHAAGATAFADFMVSEKAQKLIADFGVAQYGQPLFIPDATKPQNSIY